ncbi:MAG: hypothetical protein R3B49_00640 [Phycisphaerales bacterium]
MTALANDNSWAISWASWARRSARREAGPWRPWWGARRALGRMVVAYSVGKPLLAEHQALIADADHRLERAAALMLALADEDAAAYAEPERGDEAAARGRGMPGPRARGDRRRDRRRRAVLAAATDLLRLLESLVGRSNAHLRSDLADRGGARRKRRVVGRLERADQPPPV